MTLGPSKGAPINSSDVLSFNGPIEFENRFPPFEVVLV